MRPPRSLKARALQMLAQREQSRAELRRKLMPHAVAEEAERDKPGGAGDSADCAGSVVHANAHGHADGDVGPRPAAATRVDTLLDWLEANRYLSQERFVESRVHARASRFGNLRIRQELAQHQAVLSPEVAQALRDSELERASAVCMRKFQDPPTTATEHAKQARFLAGRGFSPETIRRVLRRTRRADPGRLPAEFPAD